jgi:hypothetical protein
VTPEDIKMENRTAPTLEELRVAYLAKDATRRDVAEEFEEAKLLPHEFWDARSALENALGIEIDGNDDLDEASVAELIEKAIETGNAENLCPVCSAGPGGPCTCVHPDERDEE